MGLFDRLFKKSATAPKLSIVVHEAFGGAIRVFEVQVSDGWLNEERSRETDDFAVMTLVYILKGEPAALVLSAKIYSAKPGVASPVPPEKTDWAALFAPLFESGPTIAVREGTQMTMKASMPALEATLDGISVDTHQPLRLRERRAVRQNELFIVSALGPAPVFEAHAAEIEAWFTTAAFVPMDES